MLCNKGLLWSGMIPTKEYYYCSMLLNHNLFQQQLPVTWFMAASLKPPWIAIAIAISEKVLGSYIQPFKLDQLSTVDMQTPTGSESLISSYILQRCISTLAVTVLLLWLVYPCVCACMWHTASLYIAPGSGSHTGSQHACYGCGWLVYLHPHILYLYPYLV